jgi:hypothetical protein
VSSAANRGQEVLAYISITHEDRPSPSELNPPTVASKRSASLLLFFRPKLAFLCPFPFRRPIAHCALEVARVPCALRSFCGSRPPTPRAQRRSAKHHHHHHPQLAQRSALHLRRRRRLCRVPCSVPATSCGCSCSFLVLALLSFIPGRMN